MADEREAKPVATAERTVVNFILIEFWVDAFRVVLIRLLDVM